MFALPGIDYFEAGNGYSGNKSHFNYRIFNQKETMKVIVWYGVMSSDKSEPAATEEFLVDGDGRERMLAWLDEQYRVCPVEYLGRERIWDL